MDPTHPIQVGGGARCFGGQEGRNASSISCKKDVEALSLDDALATVRDLRPVTFKYIADDEGRAGFIAEEVPDLIATGDRTSLSAMDFVAVLTPDRAVPATANSGAVRAFGHGPGEISPIGLNVAAGADVSRAGQAQPVLQSADHRMPALESQPF